MTAQLVRASEIRKLLDLDSDARVYDLARRALLPGVVRIGRQVRFNLAKVVTFIDAGGTSHSWRLRRADRELAQDVTHTQITYPRSETHRGSPSEESGS
jgi:hypothetical protein